MHCLWRLCLSDYQGKAVLRIARYFHRPLDVELWDKVVTPICSQLGKAGPGKRAGGEGLVTHLHDDDTSDDELASIAKGIIIIITLAMSSTS